MEYYIEKIAENIGYIVTIGGFLMVLIKPIRKAVTSFIKHRMKDKEQDEVIGELKKQMSDLVEKVGILVEQSDKNRESNLVLARKEILDIYYKYPNGLPGYKRELVIDLYKTYKSNGGNGFIDENYSEILKFPVKH